MLGLTAAQLKYKAANKELRAGEAVWVDVSYHHSLWKRSQY